MRLLVLIFISLLSHEAEIPKVKTRVIKNFFVENGKKNLTAVTKEKYNRNGDLEYYSIYKSTNKRFTEVFFINSYDSLNRRINIKEFAVENKDTVRKTNRIIKYYPNHTVEKVYGGNGELLSRVEKLFSDSTSLLIAKISFSLVPIEPFNSEWMESEKYYYDSSRRLIRISRIRTLGADGRELKYEYTDEATTICKQYNNNGKPEVVTTTVKEPRQKLELTEVYSDTDTTKAGTRTTYNAYGLIESSHNYPDQNQGFHAEYSYLYFK